MRSKEEIGAEIVRLRKEHGWTATELSRRAGLGQGTIWKIERGMVTPRRTTLEKIARALGVSIEEITGEDSRPYITEREWDDLRRVYESLRPTSRALLLEVALQFQRSERSGDHHNGT